MLGEALPPRSYQRNLDELDELLNSVSDMGFGVIDPDSLGGDASTSSVDGASEE